MIKKTMYTNKCAAYLIFVFASLMTYSASNVLPIALAQDHVSNLIVNVCFTHWVLPSPPKEDVRIVIYDDSNKKVRESLADEDLQARFCSLRPGRYAIEVYYKPTYGLRLTEFWGKLPVILNPGENVVYFSQRSPILAKSTSIDGLIEGNSREINVTLKKHEPFDPSPVRVKILIDQDRSEPYDYVLISPETILSTEKADVYCGTFSAHESGVFNMLFIVETYCKDSWLTTYQSPWEEVRIKTCLTEGFLIVEVANAAYGFEANGKVKLQLENTEMPVMTEALGYYRAGKLPGAVFAIPSGTYTTKIEYISNESLSIDGMDLVSAEQTTEVTIVQEEEITLLLEEAGIGIKVQNEMGEPITNATVRLALCYPNGIIKDIDGSERRTDKQGIVYYLHLPPNSAKSEVYLAYVCWKPSLPRITSGKAVNTVERIRAEDTGWAEGGTIRLDGAPSSVNRNSFIFRSILVIVGLASILIHLVLIPHRKTWGKLPLSERLASILKSRAILLLGVILNVLPLLSSFDSGGMAGLLAWLSLHIIILLATSGIIVITIIATMVIRKS